MHRLPPPTPWRWAAAATPPSARRCRRQARTTPSSSPPAPPSNTTLEGMTVQDFDCAWSGEAPSSWGQFRAGIAAWYTGPGMRITNNLIQHRTSGSPYGVADGIWFKSNDHNPSGGGHYIAGNTIIGGWDGIGGEEEGSAHGPFDRDTITETKPIPDCWADAPTG